MSFQITKDRCMRLATLGETYDIAAGGVASNAVVRLVAPIAGQYCAFVAGELVKVRPSSKAGTLTVERATWRNSLTISNVLAYVPDHLVCTEPNADVEAPKQKR